MGSLIGQQIEQTILHSNACMEKFHLLCNQLPGVPYALELKNQPSTSSEIAILIPTNSSTNFSPCSVQVLRNHPTVNEGEFVDILSSHQ